MSWRSVTRGGRGGSGREWVVGCSRAGVTGDGDSGSLHCGKVGYGYR